MPQEKEKKEAKRILTRQSIVMTIGFLVYAVGMASFMWILTKIVRGM
jgi:hypothetical protein